MDMFFKLKGVSGPLGVTSVGPLFDECIAKSGGVQVGGSTLVDHFFHKPKCIVSGLTPSKLEVFPRCVWGG